MNLQQKTIVITGATSGIGLATAEALVRAGANVIGVGRSDERCRQTQEHLQQLYPSTRIAFLCADLSQQSNVHRLAGQIKNLLAASGTTALDGLVNNAAAFTYWLNLTCDGVETQWAVNHLAGFMLTQTLLPLLQAASRAAVVTVSSESHRGARIHWDDPQLRRRYNGLAAYGCTKLANILFTIELTRRLGTASTVRAYAVDPGLVKTDIGLKGNPGLVGWAWKMRRFAGTSPAVPARCIAYLLEQMPAANPAQVYWKDCRPVNPDRRALDSESAARLWDLSLALCGMVGR